MERDRVLVRFSLESQGDFSLDVHRREIVFNNYFQLHELFSELSQEDPIRGQTYSFFPNRYSDWLRRIILKPGQFSQRDLLIELPELILSVGHQLVLSWEESKEIAEALLNLNYKIYESQLGMFLPNSKRLVLQEKLSDPNIIFRKLTDGDEIETWLYLVNDAFGSTDQSELYRRAFSEEAFLFYAAFCQDEMVATALTFQNQESVGLYSVTTSPNYRNRGIASRLVGKIITESESSLPFILQATKMGKGIYDKLGFLEIGTFRHWQK
ncbi:acetyltransferase (GNAT) domain protein [Leptospira fainei serovar Hurstbridge str. BUT 6]|uniref:Acetyltransferase (GNAT) domain protein n=1 Tax=Leptospira fainei serovar Hurstbridge str. BUT 6 TaxID=1193011 RepID=S3USG8_9LEPT|nr:GNAT family N-acetyltransferase [Leptospira fainei]EPG73351.1 acetyltransferase (GNAT) domain protein [Leptospira fainei serovar Hurstbridge str. BUT 6]